MPEDFQGTARFSIERRLGSGGFGVVYRAFDHKRNATVALKALRDVDSDGLYRFKQEFRSLTDLSHPNLVSLYELLAEGEQWFFTMELIDGVSLLDHVRGARTDGQAVPSRVRSFEATLRDPPKHSGEVLEPSARLDTPSSPSRSRPCDEEGYGRLRSDLLQLADGLHALHAAGKLHRDIKPSNVLVTPEGRVVLLDFGLVFDLGPEQRRSLNLVGTPAYMSPEQSRGIALSEASDWYSVGVILFEALTGRRPFHGDFLDVLVEKQSAEPPSPHELIATVPEDLDRLCHALLRKDPSLRPVGRAVLEVLRVRGPEREAQPPTRAVRESPFVGRSAHLEVLWGAYKAMKEGRPATVYVRGASGMGKSALVRRFLNEIAANEPNVVILAGRCYEREAVPYKALDSLVDSLSQYLKRLPLAEAEALLPRDLLVLSRVFPVLRQVEAVARARRRLDQIPDSQELRRRAFGALRELLARLGDRAPLLLFIDDLQWGDRDSVAPLLELLRPPDPPVLLLIGCYRSEDAGESDLLQALLGYRMAAGSATVEEVEVGEFEPAEARQLATALLGDDFRDGVVSPEEIARESRGNPFFIDELVRHARAGEALLDIAPPRPGDHGLRLEEVIRARLARLPEAARRLLEVVAVAGLPLEREIARQASGLENEEPSLGLLRANHLLRGSGSGNEEKIETYHDRIRETVVSGLSEKALEEIHEKLAFTLEVSRFADAETLALHYQGAGAPERAALYAAEAASRAAGALAFDRAARLYQLALELGGAEPAEAQKLRVRLGDALANAGRGAEAAAAYLEAVSGADAAETLELQRRAAEQLLRSGHVDEGLTVLKALLARIGMRLARTPWSAVISLALRMLQVRLRGLRFREREESQIAPEELIRIDTCWSVASGLSMIDTIRGREFQMRHLLLALKAGEPFRVARALGNEAGYSGLRGLRAHRRTQRLVEGALALAHRVRNPHALGMAHLGAGISAYLEGRWKTGWELAQQCERIFREQCTGTAWELVLTHVYSLRALVFLGQLGELSNRLPGLLKEAGERGDLFAETSLRTRLSYVVSLMSDEPVRAREELDHAVAQWSHQGFYLQHYFHLLGETEISLYAGPSPVAWRGLLSRWRALERSLLIRGAELFRIEARHLRARCAIAAACATEPGPVSETLLASARQDARRIAKEGTAWGGPLARLIEAALACSSGKPDEAASLLSSAEAGFEKNDMGLYSWAARRVRGLLIGGEEGRELVQSADKWMAEQKIVNPERMTLMLAPGPWRAASGTAQTFTSGPS
jgi:eukaryotic-like serine/threonine-protein kinase